MFDAVKNKSTQIKSMTMTIGQIAKLSGLSRSALLYYDSIDLLKPSGRSRANYRRYTQEDARRLELICLYRQMGLSLQSIANILRSPQSIIRDILEKQLLDIGRQITRLREQQHAIIRMLNDDSLHDRLPVMDKEHWITLLRAVGLNDEGLLKWHKEFEKLSPLSHQEFLEGLGIPKQEIAMVRQLSKT
jgi:DNA-binding transcriptional MerR regulator